MKAGDRVLKRGFEHRGTVKRVSDFEWVSVEWDAGPMPRERPRVCLPRELEKIADVGAGADTSN
jgi:hypothetical protein